MSRVFSIRYWGDYTLLTKTACFAIDTGVLVFSFLVASWFGSLQALSLTLVLQVALIWSLGLNTIVWRYIGFADLKNFAWFAVVSTGLLALFGVILPNSLVAFQIPILVSVADGVLVFAGLISVRVLRRAIYEHQTGAQRVEENSLTRTLLIGAGSVGSMAASAFQKSSRQKLNLIGFVDDDPRKRFSTIRQLQVLGNIDELPALVKKYKIALVVITIARISGVKTRRIVEICKDIPVPVRVVPGYSDIVQGNCQVNQIREVKIEDLLRREPVDLDLKAIGQFLKNKKVLVTGAGGSIGSELSRQVAGFNPSELVLLDISEAALFEIEQELISDRKINPICCVANCTNMNKMTTVLRRYRPQIVLHAAAYKHVSMMEQNPFEVIDCNVFGAQITARAAGEVGVETFILISTDKAVRPSSMMGASKHLAELIVAKLNTEFDTKYMVVRFGNVLGSSGSVVPIFKKQIASGGPVTVTDSNMCRYFMTIPEACQLVLQAACSGKGGELFILDMGKPVKILDLAEDMIRLSGFIPYDDIQIVFSGMKKGEKIAEELYADNEIAGSTSHPQIHLGKISHLSESIPDLLAQLNSLLQTQNESSLRNYLSERIIDSQLSPTCPIQSHIAPDLT